jgi:hypothetical protein
MKTKQCCVALSPNHKGALILVRSSSIELLGPGSAILWIDEESKQPIFWTCGDCEHCGKSDSSIAKVFVIGEAKLEVLDTLAQQKKALWRRVTWLNWLNRLQETPSPVQRIESLIQHLNIFFGREVCQSLPSELLARLLGCEEIELLWVRDRYFQDWSWDISSRPSKASWVYLSSQGWQEVLLRAFQHQRQSSNFCPHQSPSEVVKALPKSAPWSESQWTETLAKISPFDFSEQDPPSWWDSSFQFKAV